VVLLVLAAVGAVLAQALAERGATAAEAACRQNVVRINQAIEKWFFDKGHWPAADLSDIGSDRAYFPSGIPRCPMTGEPYKADPQAHRVVPHSH
jgi:hypothetical protein